MFSPTGDHVVLIRKNHPEWQKGKFNGIGGKIADGERSISAMAREFREETGVQTYEADWQELVVIEGPEHRVEFFYAHSDKYLQVSTATDEVVAIQFPDALPNNTIFNLNWLIPLALDPNAIKPLGLIHHPGGHD
jgi:8-oxo-dGTP diphosphatase